MARINRLLPSEPITERQERIENQEERRKKLVGAAVAVGITYVGYRNLPKIIDTATNLAAKTTISLSRNARGTRFEGLINEAINLNKALDETIEYSPSGLVRTFMREGKTEYLNDRVDYLNKNSRSFLDSKYLGDTIKDFAASKTDFSRQARVDSSLKIIKDAYESDDKGLFSVFGEQADEAYHIISNNSEQLFRSSTRQKRLSGVDSADTEIHRLIRSYSDDVTKTVQLNFENEYDQARFIEKMTKSVDEIRSIVNNQEVEYRNMLGGSGKLSDNLFGQYYELYEMANFESLRNRRTLPDAFNDAMESNGWRRVSMGEASAGFVTEDEAGKAFFSTVEEGAEKLQDYYGQKRITNNFADEYIKQGTLYGLDRKNLSSDYFSENLYVNTITNELLNISAHKDMAIGALDSFEQSFQVPFLGFNPVSFLRSKNRDTVEEAFAILAGGSDIQSLVPEMEQMLMPDELRNINARANPLARSYLFSNGNIIDSDIAASITGESLSNRFESYQNLRKDFQLEGKYYLSNARTGQTSRMAQAFSGRTSRDDLDQMGVLRKGFQLGVQEKNSNISSVTDVLRQKLDPEYAQNPMIDLIHDAATQDDVLFSQHLDDAYNQLFSQHKNLSPESREALYDSLNDALRGAGLTVDGENIDMFKVAADDDYALDVLKSIADKKSTRHRVRDIEDIHTEIDDMLQRKAKGWINNAYERDPEGFLNSTRYLKDNRVLKPDSFYMMDQDIRPNAVERIDDVRMLIEQYAINRADLHYIDYKSPIYETYRALSKNVEEELAGLKAINELTYFKNHAKDREFEINKHAMDFFQNYYNVENQEFLNMAYSLRDVPKLSGTGSRRGENLLGNTQFVAIKQGKNVLQEVHESLHRNIDDFSNGGTAVDLAANLARDILGTGLGAVQEGLAGTGEFSSQIGDITTITRNLFFFADRLDRPLQQMGLGLSNQSKTSALAIIGMQWATRVVGPWMAWEGLKLADGLTGDFVSDSMADAYVNMQLDLASIKETLGINMMGNNINRILPWLEQTKEWPVVGAFNAATLGMFSEFRNREELERYYVSGEDPIRKGRYWGIGSSSPWQGGRIEYYKPNWYRTMKSDYMFAENVYGSEFEYWTNHPVVNPIKHFITDPYHYEEKHAESRPYVMTGGFDSLNNIPLVGPAANKIVSSVLKPTKINPLFEESHKERVERERQGIISNYLGMNAGGTLTLGSDGSMHLQSNQYSVSFPDEESSDSQGGFISNQTLDEDLESFTLERDRYISSVYHDVSLENVYMRGGGSSGMSSAYITEEPKGIKKLFGKDKTKLDLRYINQQLTDRRTNTRNDDPRQAGTMVSPNTIVYERDAVNSTAILENQGLYKDLQYRATEMAGMYGFLSTTIPGVEDTRSLPVLETSSRFNNMADNFWDMNLGGLGGDFSEIFRRYLPRDTNKYYNPIKNQMPDWINYVSSINFFNCWELLLHMQGQSAA